MYREPSLLPNALDTIFKKNYRIFFKTTRSDVSLFENFLSPPSVSSSVFCALRQQGYRKCIENDASLLPNLLDTIFKKSYRNFFKTTRSDDSFYENLLISLSKQRDNRGVSSSALNCDSYLMRIENLFLAKFTKASKSPLINASFFALDHFLICFSFSIAIVISVNSQ